MKTMQECWGEKYPFAESTEMEMDCSLQRACNWLFASYTWVKTSAVQHHGQNKGWALWTKNADLALSYQLAWKTTTCNRKQSYTVSSFLQTGGGEKSISLYFVLQCFLYGLRAIRYNHPSMSVLFGSVCLHTKCRFNTGHILSLMALCVCWVTFSIVCVLGFCLSTVWYVGINKLSNLTSECTHAHRYVVCLSLLQQHKLCVLPKYRIEEIEGKVRTDGSSCVGCNTYSGLLCA